MSNYGLITFFAILGAAALVVCGFVVNRFFGNPEDKKGDTPSNDQMEYMRSVRHRYLDALEGTARLV
jgi:hypothetical protein